MLINARDNSGNSADPNREQHAVYQGYSWATHEPMR